MKRKVFILKDCCFHDTATVHDNSHCPSGFYRSFMVPVATDDSLMLLLCTRTNSLLELNCVRDGPRSWLIGNSVESDGCVYVATPYDPLFTILHYLYASRHVAQSVDQLLCDANFPDCSQLISLVDPSHLLSIAVKKGDEDLCAFMYSEERVLKWLQGKVNAVTRCLQEQRQLRLNDKHHISVVTEVTAAETHSYACGIIAKYLPDGILSALCERMSIKNPMERATRSEEPPPCKKSRLTSAPVPHEDYTTLASSQTTSKCNVLSSKQKELAKSATGTKSILSFFGKKK